MWLIWTTKEPHKKWNRINNKQLCEKKCLWIIFDKKTAREASRGGEPHTAAEPVVQIRPRSPAEALILLFLRVHLSFLDAEPAPAHLPCSPAYPACYWATSTTPLWLGRNTWNLNTINCMKLKRGWRWSWKEREQQRGTCGGCFRAALTTENSQEQQLQSRLVIQTAGIASDFLSWVKLPHCENQDI